MDQLVSILIPAYNAGAWLAETVESAINQTWPNKEIIIVDDGSSDNTLRIAKGYESRFVKVVSQENRGASAARNKALSFAQGDYIQWLDADDLLAPDKISQQMKYVNFDDNKRMLLSSAWGRFFYNRPQKAIFSPTTLWTDLTPVEWIYRKLNENIYMALQCWLVSRELTELAGPWNENLSLDDDGEYFIRVIVSSELIKFIPEAKSYCRNGNTGSLSSVVNRSDKKLESQFFSLCAHMSSLLSLEDSERTRGACLNLLQGWFIYFYPEKKDIVKRARELALEIGGSLSVPRLKWKYSLIKNVFGWTIAKNLMFRMPAFKMILRETVYRLLYVSENKST